MVRYRHPASRQIDLQIMAKATSTTQVYTMSKDEIGLTKQAASNLIGIRFAHGIGNCPRHPVSFIPSIPRAEM
jgi:hypothetical protein